MILIFKTLYSDCVVIFAFNNSSNHAAFSKDTLIVNKINLSLGGK